VQHADVFGEGRRLHAERAADMAGQDAHKLGLDLENLRQRSPLSRCRRLSRIAERQKGYNKASATVLSRRPI
jgi:hypothetical protein